MDTRQKGGIPRAPDAIRQLLIGQTEAQANKLSCFTSAKPCTSAGGIVNDRRERHLLLKLSDFVIEPGEKAHFTVAGKQTWNFMPLQPDFDYSTSSVLPTVREYLVVDVQKGVDQDPFVCTTNYSASNPLAMRLSSIALRSGC